MSNNTETNVVNVIGAVRIPMVVVNNLLMSVVGELSDDKQTILERLTNEHNFHTRATCLAQDVLISTTLANTMLPSEPFSPVLSYISFCGDDQDLKRIGEAMEAKIRALPRLEDTEIADNVLKDRFDGVFSALLSE